MARPRQTRKQKWTIWAPKS